MIGTGWETAELAALLTTYIGGIEEVLHAPMLRSVAYLERQIDDVYDTVAPIVGQAIADSDVNLPGE